MNYFKFIICWFNESHVFAKYFDKNGKPVRKCIRCGYENWYKEVK